MQGSSNESPNRQLKPDKSEESVTGMEHLKKNIFSIVFNKKKKKWRLNQN